MINTSRKPITQEAVSKFLEGRDPQMRIVNLDYKGESEYITIYYRDENDNKCVGRQPFYPFLWAKREVCVQMCGGNRKYLRSLMNEYSIEVKELDCRKDNGEICEEIAKDGYVFMFYALRPLSYYKFLEFFKRTGFPVYAKSGKNKNSFTNVSVSKKDDSRYICLTPQEQFLTSTGKRFFKGYDDYDDVLRMIFDLETTGLDTKKDRIEQIGIRFNRPVKYKGKYVDFERIYTVEGETEEEKNISEIECIDKTLRVIYTFMPDIITAHNGEAFDWNMFIGACERLGTTLEKISEKYFNGTGIKKDKRESILKLGGEIETYYRTLVPGIIVTDSLHAVRRAQALDSNMLFSNLKYVTKYSKIVKPDRVYVPGDKISTIWNDNENNYAFCKEDGDWYIYDPSYETQASEFKKGKNDNNFSLYTRNYIEEEYQLVTGRYIVTRYLLDDLWECDKVEHRYNIPNFLICKMIPVPYQRCCTMGTAGQWKSLLLAWSYENNLAIPPFRDKKKFTGGLSRLLKVGFVSNVAKFDYNSLYPAIILTWSISDDKDLMNVMLYFLEYILTQREKYKKLKKAAKKKADSIKERLKNRDYNGKEEGKALNAEMMKWLQEESANDKKQLPLKIFGNSFFGSFGAPNVFNWASIDCAERTTCTGRQALRLMISHFTKLGYQPIVGDSVLGDTPLLIKYKGTGIIDIKPISELMNGSIETDYLGREYDATPKQYQVLCRSGWNDIKYIYRHKTEKPIYEIKDGDINVEVTEDHSLFDINKNEIKPSEINSDTRLEMYDEKNGVITTHKITGEFNELSVKDEAVSLANGDIDRVGVEVLNAPLSVKKLYYDTFISNSKENVKYSKVCLAGLLFLKKCLKNSKK